MTRFRLLFALGGCLSGAALLAHCALLVGISDTNVVSDGSADGTAAKPTVSPDGSSDASPAETGADSTTSPPTDDATATAESGPVDATQPPADTTAPPPSDAGDTGTPDAPAGDGGCGAGCPINMPTCENGQCIVRGPTMVPVSTFYVDRTEVTVAEYKQFLAANVPTSGQPAVCTWNTSYYDTTIPMNPDTFPMTFIDWCDAVAYCTWTGKHLCGKIGGGPIAYADVYTPSLSQWVLACGGPGGSSHPSNADQCNSSDGFGGLAAVATYPGCEGYYPGLFDMEGNAAEWVDDCDPDDAGTSDSGVSGDICHLMGGSFVDQQSYCEEVTYDYPRDTTAITFGFRCCGG